MLIDVMEELEGRVASILAGLCEWIGVGRGGGGGGGWCVVRVERW